MTPRRRQRTRLIDSLGGWKAFAPSLLAILSGAGACLNRLAQEAIKADQAAIASESSLSAGSAELRLERLEWRVDSLMRSARKLEKRSAKTAAAVDTVRREPRRPRGLIRKILGGLFG